MYSHIFGLQISYLLNFISISLQGMFGPFMVESATELTLGANRNLTDAQRLQWKTKDHTTDGSKIFFLRCNLFGNLAQTRNLYLK